jgi:HAMP domain-containing protein
MAVCDTAGVMSGEREQELLDEIARLEATIRRMETALHGAATAAAFGLDRTGDASAAG